MRLSLNFRIFAPCPQFWGLEARVERGILTSLLDAETQCSVCNWRMSAAPHLCVCS